jgi:CRP-like cAMP-binding protein
MSPISSSAGGQSSANRRSLLVLDPTLAEAIEPDQHELARRALHVEVVELPIGPCELGDPGPSGCVGYLVCEGLLMRQLRMMGSQSTEPLGPGDLIRPWQEDVVSFAESEFVALAPATVACLDRDVIARAAHFPGLIEALMDKAMQRARFLALSAAIDGLVGVDRRLSALMWALAERWGEIRDGAIYLPIELPHEALAGLVAARRPSVSTALSQLQQEGRLERVSGGWLLHDRPPELGA